MDNSKTHHVYQRKAKQQYNTKNDNSKSQPLMKYTFFISNTRGWNWQKIKEMLSNTLRLNFCYLKTIHILHPHFHSKTIGHVLKNKQKNKCVFIQDYTINHRRWIPNPGVMCLKPLGGSKVDSAFHFSEVDKMNIRNFWELSGKK